MKGGYSMIDCTGFDLGNPTSVAGIYNKLMTAYKSNKLVICQNMKNGSAKFTPIAAFVATETEGTTVTIVLTIMNLPYRISADDSIVQA